MKLSRHRRQHRVGTVTFESARSQDGVARLWAANQNALACALGAAHAHDRQVQMTMARIVGQGRISECLADNDATFEVDLFMRSMGFRRQAERQVEELSPETRAFAESYAAGVNHVFDTEGRPLEFRLVGHRPERVRVLAVAPQAGVHVGHEAVEVPPRLLAKRQTLVEEVDQPGLAAPGVAPQVQPAHRRERRGAA